MRINYSITGKQRKSLAGAISQELNAPMSYLGVPTFSYAVGAYQIDRNGTLIGEDNPDLVTVLQKRYSFVAFCEEYELPFHQADSLDGMISPCRDDVATQDSGEPGLSKPSDISHLTIEMPLEGFTDEALTNLEKLIASKASLIKKAIGTDNLPIERTDDTIRFPWFQIDASSDAVAAYSAFVAALCAAAIKAARVTAKEKAVDNEKYAFRVFLLRLGFIGDGFKNERKILLRNLSGNSSYKNQKPNDAEM